MALYRLQIVVRPVWNQINTVSLWRIVERKSPPGIGEYVLVADDWAEPVTSIWRKACDEHPVIQLGDRAGINAGGKDLVGTAWAAGWRR